MSLYYSTPIGALAAITLMVALPCGGAGQAPREIAVTFDDLPVVTYVFRDIHTQQRITSTLLAAIQRYSIPAIGFINESALTLADSIDPRQVALLRQWIEAGLELGNHTYSHFDLHRVSLTTYLDDIHRGDSVTALLLQSLGRRPRYFRHPFLHSGRDLDTRRTVERFLSERGYRVAPVTIDNNDYLFASAYEQATARGDENERRQIATLYVQYMERMVAYYERQSFTLLGRELRQVLLLHANMLNADHLGSLAAMLKRRGYHFVSLDRALSDAAYESEDTYTGPGGISWLHRWAFTQGKRRAFFEGEPTVPEYIAKAATLPPSLPRR